MDKVADLVMDAVYLHPEFLTARNILQWETMIKQKIPIINQTDRGRRRKWSKWSKSFQNKKKVRKTQKVANRKQTG